MKILSDKVESRYEKHIKISDIGKDGQKIFAKKRVVLIGCGALGSNIANLMVRGGIGEILVVDRDVVELDNLHRQVLFSEKDIGRAKAEIAALKLRRINSDVKVKFLVKNVNSSNISEIADGYDLIFDGTDNIPVRMLINDFAIKENIPWIYGGVLGTGGMVMNILNGSPCLRCLIPEVSELGTVPTCETTGILNTVPAIAASFQVTEAMKILMGKSYLKGLLQFDVWSNDFTVHEFSQDPNCECCGKRNFTFLSEESEEQISILCDDSVQIILKRNGETDLEMIAKKIKGVENLKVNPFRLEFEADEKSVTIFKDGRIIVKGTNDPGVARSIYSKFFGL